MIAVVDILHTEAQTRDFGNADTTKRIVDRTILIGTGDFCSTTVLESLLTIDG